MPVNPVPNNAKELGSGTVFVPGIEPGAVNVKLLVERLSLNFPFVTYVQ